MAGTVPTLRDRVLEVSQTVGAGDMVLLGARSGHQTFVAAGFVDGDTTYYTIENGVDWEVGCGTFRGSPSRLERDIVIDSSNAKSAVVWGAGDKVVFITLPASKVGEISGVVTVFELERMFDTARSSSYAKFNPDLGTGDLKSIDVWDVDPDPGPATKLFTRTFTYNGGGDLILVVTLDEVNGTTLTTTLTYTAEGDLEDRTKVIA